MQVLADMRLVALMLDTIEGDIRNQVSVLPITELKTRSMQLAWSIAKIKTSRLPKRLFLTT